jgi:alanine dehydrogenase
MSEGCTLFCMAHFQSYPDRAKLLQDRCVNVVAMEEISESPKVNLDREILGCVAMAESLKPFIEKNTIGDLQVRIIGWSKRLRSAIRRCGNRNSRSLQIIQPTLSFEDLNAVGPEALYFYDSPNFEDRQGTLVKLKNNGTHIFDLHEFEKQYAEQAIDAYRTSHPPLEFGLRRIQCLHETGQAGARYGVKLLKKINLH